MDDDRISLAHGNGGRFMRELIEDVFAVALSASELDAEYPTGLTKDPIRYLHFPSSGLTGRLSRTPPSI